MLQKSVVKSVQAGTIAFIVCRYLFKCRKQTAVQAAPQASTPAEPAPEIVETIPVEEPQIPTEGMIAHYEFNGNTKSETFMYDAQIKGMASYAEDMYGNPNSCLLLNGNGQVITPIRTETGDNWTFSGWFFDTIGNSRAWKASQDTVDDTTNVWLFRGNLLSLYTNRNGFNLPFTNIANKWVFYCIVFNGNTISFYQRELGNDLMYIGNITLDTAYKASDRPIIIGGRESNEYNFQGMIDDVRVYNKPLNEQEIVEISTK